MYAYTYTRAKSWGTVLRGPAQATIARFGRLAALVLLVSGLGLAAGTATASADQPGAPVPAAHLIANAVNLAPPLGGTGGGGAIDYWKVSLAGGDDVQFNLTYNGSPYELDLYPPQTTDETFATVNPVDTAHTLNQGVTSFTVNLQAPYNGTFILAVCETPDNGNCASALSASGSDPMDPYSFTTTWLTKVDPTQESKETRSSTLIQGALKMPPGNFEAGGGGPIDFWKVGLKRGDKVAFNLSDGANSYEYALYPPGTSDNNFASSTPVASTNSQADGHARHWLILKAPTTATFILAVCENVTDSNCSNAESGSGTNPMNEYTFSTSLVGGLETSSALSLSASHVRYGHERKLKLRVRTTAKFGGKLAGKVAGKVVISAGKKRICVAKLSGGKGVCSPTRKKLLAVGKHSLVARYRGSFLSSHSRSKKLTVRK